MMLTVDVTRLDLRPGERLLDIGCGRGRHLHAAALHCPGLSVVGLDPSREDLAAARQGMHDLSLTSPNLFLSGDALRLPFADDAFDHVLCTEVLEHLPAYEPAIQEILRVTRPGGTLSVSVPRFWPEWICWRLSAGYRSSPGGHVRIFKEPELRAAFTAAGAAWQRRHWAHGLHSPYWWMACALWSRKDKHPLTRLYHRFLVWDLMKQPRLTRWLSRIADPLMGKSVVLYFRKPGPAVQDGS